MLGACTPKQSRRFFSQEAAAFCCIGFPFGGSCQWPRPPTDEGQVCHSHPFAGSCNKRAPHPALRGHLPPLGEGSGCRKRCVHPLAPSARGLRPQAVGERTVRLPEIFRAMIRSFLFLLCKEGTEEIPKLDKNTFLHKFDGVPFALRAYLCYNK